VRVRDTLCTRTVLLFFNANGTQKVVRGRCTDFAVSVYFTKRTVLCISRHIVSYILITFTFIMQVMPYYIRAIIGQRMCIAQSQKDLPKVLIFIYIKFCITCCRMHKRVMNVGGTHFIHI
jgi:hypothetical protein